MGPLPSGDRNDELQQLSLAALRSLLPVDRFLFRDERVDDKGIDGAIELKVNGAFTNIRAQVQLKATDNPNINVDGSYSLQVAVNNLNYLLNGPSPLYIIWIAPRQEFRFAWAREIASRLYEDNPDWLNQTTVSLRMNDLLTHQSCDALFDHILREGQLHRNTHNRLAETASVQQVTIRIDPRSLETVTDQQAYDWVVTSGLALVAAGHASVVRELIRLLSPSKLIKARVRLVSGYAAHSQGDFFAARAELGRAMSDRDQFTEIDGYMLDALLVDCDYCLGRITNDVRKDRQLSLEGNAPLSIALQLTLDRLRNEHLIQRDRTTRAKIRGGIDQIVTLINNDQQATESLKLRAKLTRLYAEATDATSDHIHTLTLLRARADMGYRSTPPDLLERAERTFATERRHDSESDDCIKEAHRLQNPMLIAESILTRSIILVVRLTNSRILTPAQNSGQLTQAFIQAGLDQLLQAENHFRAAGSDEGVVRAVLLQADWLVACGKDDVATECVRKIEGIANGLGLERHIKRIANHRAGTTEHHVLFNTLANPPDETRSMASRSDADIKDMAMACLESLGLPIDRLPIIERECLSRRVISQEKLSWCRHLELIQDLHHQQSPDTHFRTDPPRKCICTLHKYSNIMWLSDWAVQITAFKGSRCITCSDRSPKE